MDEKNNKNKFIAHLRERDGEEQSLECHLIEVAEIAGRLAAKIDLPVQGELLGL